MADGKFMDDVKFIHKKIVDDRKIKMGKNKKENGKQAKNRKY